MARARRRTRTSAGSACAPGVVRGLVLRDAPEALEKRLLAALAAPKGSSERAVGVFGAVALGLRDAVDVVGACSRPPAIARRSTRRRAARSLGASAPSPPSRRSSRRSPGSGAASPPGAASAAKSGDAAPDPAAISAGVALLAEPGGGAIATSRLAALAEAGGPLSPLAARALAARDDEVVRGGIERLLEGERSRRARARRARPRERPHARQRLLLARAYRFEDDPAVRRAIVRGLSRRAEVQRRRVLVAARDLDPDEGCARSRGLPSPASTRGRSIFRAPRWRRASWVAIVPNDQSASRSASSRPARLVRPDGLAVPVVADPDGVLLVPAVPPGASAVLLAPAAPPGDPGS